MSVKVDVDKSTKARTEGNVSFKKGRWTEAIRHYTTAIVFDPQEGLGYTNRAAAYLKIDKWKDAERDCTTALGLAKANDQPNVKALYRRSLARKAQDDLDGAIQDIDEVLKLEPTNETAQEEKVELEKLRVKAAQVREAKSRDTKALPPSPPRAPKKLASEVDTPAANTAETQSLGSVEAAQPAVPIAAKGGSFADLKKGRQAGRKTFAAPTSQSDIPSNTTPSPTSPSSLPLKDVSITEPHPSSKNIQTQASTVSPPASLPPLDPLAPGSALAFVSSIRRYPPSSTLSQIEHLSARPEALGKMLDNFLEPDQLALILGRLRETLGLKGVDREVIRRFMVGLTQTRRWAMTSIMLSKQEKELGQQVWEEAGGQGDWAQRQPL